MPRGGNNAKPTFQVVREGNPGHRPVREGVVLPPTALAEPSWASLLPGSAAETKRARETAARTWAKTAATLHRSVGLVHEQQDILVDYCITVARIEQCERSLSRDGLVIPAGRADRGMVRNPITTVLNQYRSHFRSLGAELGLTPSAASRLTRPNTGPDDDDDPFD
jgi:P27 family predicted phage terminase small subunit